MGLTDPGAKAILPPARSPRLGWILGSGSPRTSQGRRAQPCHAPTLPVNAPPSRRFRPLAAGWPRGAPIEPFPSPRCLGCRHGLKTSSVPRRPVADSSVPAGASRRRSILVSSSTGPSGDDRGHDDLQCLPDDLRLRDAGMRSLHAPGDLGGEPRGGDRPAGQLPTGPPARHSPPGRARPGDR